MMCRTIDCFGESGRRGHGCGVFQGQPWDDGEVVQKRLGMASLGMEEKAGNDTG